MQIKSFCFILPTEIDEPQKFYSAKHSLPREGCGAPSLELFRHSLNRLFRSGRFTSCCHHRPPPSHKPYFDAQGVPIQEDPAGQNPRIFSYSELYIGSNGFDEREILGRGGFGRVYRAVLPSDGTAVAVKRLAEDRPTGGFEKTFLAELAAVAHLRHRNLVRLRGWCLQDGGGLLLVYDYMPNRSLDGALFGKAEAAAALSWRRRTRIIDGLAAALHYLHEQLETQIIHRDVKTSNVMLDSDFNARLGDFGLARWLEHGLSYESTDTPSGMFRLAESSRIGGTIGYLPPESFRKKNKATTKSDVFGFGIVVLEIVSGRRAVDLTYPDDRIVLLDWIRRLSDEGRLLAAKDARPEDPPPDLERFLRLGLMCTHHDPRFRPSMKWVVEFLSGNIDKLPDLPSFRSQPLYISISSSPITTTTSNSMATNSSQTITIRSSSLYHSLSDFVSADAETIYLTVESETSGGPASAASIPPNSENTFPVIETPTAITYGEIVSATDDFSDSRRAAEVDFGTSYRGLLDGGRHVIIRRLGMKTCPALRTRFADELRNMGRLRHRNLTQLRGWCTERGEMLVVYDYSPSRLLRNILVRQKPNNGLDWRARYEIIRSLASAVRYLHEEWDEQVIHRNITSAAITLDRDSSPRLGSFALAEFLTRNEHGLGHHGVAVDRRKSIRGIFGYMSPEYMESGEATAAADVYSFGVVVLEVVMGRAAVDFREREVMLVGRVRRWEEEGGKYEELVDERLGGEYDGREMERVVRLGLECTRSEPELRPSMRQVVSIMDGYDRWLVEARGRRKTVGMEEWKQRNASSLSLVRRIQALTIQ